MSPRAGDGDRLAATLAGRLKPAADEPAPAGPQRWEERHVRVTVWMDRAVRDELWAAAELEGLSRRQVIDEMARAWLAARSPGGASGGRRRSR